MNRIQKIIMEQEYMKSTRFLCLALMIKRTSKNSGCDGLGLRYQNYLLKKTVILITIQKSFFVKQTVVIFNLIRTAFFAKKLMKNISEKLMPIASHPKKWWNFCVSEDEKKQQNQFLLRSCKSVRRQYTIWRY